MINNYFVRIKSIRELSREIFVIRIIRCHGHLLNSETFKICPIFFARNEFSLIVNKYSRAYARTHSRDMCQRSIRDESTRRNWPGIVPNAYESRNYLQKYHPRNVNALWWNIKKFSSSKKVFSYLERQTTMTKRKTVTINK